MRDEVPQFLKGGVGGGGAGFPGFRMGSYPCLEGVGGEPQPGPRPAGSTPSTPRPTASTRRHAARGSKGSCCASPCTAAPRRTSGTGPASGSTPRRKEQGTVEPAQDTHFCRCLELRPFGTNLSKEYLIASPLCLFLFLFLMKFNCDLLHQQELGFPCFEGNPINALLIIFSHD